MNLLIRKYVEDYNFEHKTTRSVIKENILNICSGIEHSFMNEILHKRIDVIIEIDLIQMYNVYEETNDFLKNYGLYKKEIREFLKKIILEVLRMYGYRHIYFVLIDKIYNVKIIFKTFPIFLNNVRGIRMRDNMIRIVKGKLGFEKEEVLGSVYAFKCTNEKCISPMIVLSFYEYGIGIRLKTKEFEKVEYSKKTRNCSSCYSKMDPAYCKVDRLYRYMVCFDGMWIPTEIPVKLDIEEAAVIGVTNKDRNKGWRLNGMTIYEYKRCEPTIRYNIMSSFLDEKIREITSYYIPYQYNIKMCDCFLFIILNIFHIRISEEVLESPESEKIKENKKSGFAHNRLDRMELMVKNKVNINDYNDNKASFNDYNDNKASFNDYNDNYEIFGKKYLINRDNYNNSDQSVNCRNNNETTYGNRAFMNTNEEVASYVSTRAMTSNKIKMLIYTNDIGYVKKIAVNIVDVPIIYSLESGKSKSSFICIRSIYDTDKAASRQIVDYTFDVRISGILETTYKKDIFYKFHGGEIIFEDKLIKSIKDAYLHFRKKFKGNIKPETLFNTIEALTLSIFHIVGTKTTAYEVSEYLKKYFKNMIFNDIKK